MFGIANWKTSAAGLAPLFASASMIMAAIGDGKMPDSHDMSIIIGLLSTAIGLFASKDKNVTGGTTPNGKK